MTEDSQLHNIKAQQQWHSLKLSSEEKLISFDKKKKDCSAKASKPQGDYQ